MPTASTSMASRASTIEKLLKRKTGVVNKLAMGVKGLLRKNKVKLINGFGTVTAKDQHRGDQ